MKKESGYIVIVAILIHFVVIKRILSFKYSNGIYEFLGWLLIYGVIYGISEFIINKTRKNNGK